MVAGQKREALTFNGVNNWVTMGDVLDMGTSDFSIMSWAKTTSVVASANNGVVYKKGTSQQYNEGYALNMPNGAVRLTVGDGTDSVAIVRGSGYNNDQWHQIGSVLDSGVEARAYADGALQGAALSAAAVDNADNAIPLSIGALRLTSGNLYHQFTGTIDEVRIYNRVLTAAEITELYRMDTTSVIDASGHRTTAP